MEMGWSKFLSKLHQEGSMKRLTLFGLLVAAALSASVGVPAALADGGADGGPQLVFLSSPSPDYGYVPVGSVETNTYTVENVGSGKGGALSVTAMGSGDWTIVNDTCSWVTLAPGQTCSISISYEPLRPGDDMSVSLTVNAKRSLANATINLTGTTDPA
jgi:hypothetical protein